MAIVNNITTEDGDIIRIKTDSYLVGITALTSFIDDVDNESGSIYFDKEFRINQNGTYTSWTTLNATNLAAVTVVSTDTLLFEYRYTRVGVGTPDLEFNSISITGDYTPNSYPLYFTTEYSNWANPDNIEVLGWAVNVLEKIMSDKYLASYITKSLDQRQMLFTTTTMFAMMVIYCRKINDTLSSDTLMREFLSQIGLFVQSNTDNQEVLNLILDYVNEFTKRGSIEVFEDGEEMLRLVNYQTGDEYVKAHVKRGEMGWCMGNSSPMYNITKGIHQTIKGYEQSDEVEDLTKYPILSSGSVSIVSGQMEIETTSDGNKAGFGFSTDDKDFLIPIDPQLDYALSVYVENASTLTAFGNFSLGIRSFDKDFAELKNTNAITGLDSNYFLEESIIKQNGEHLIEAVLRNKDASVDTDDRLWNGGNNLIINENTRYVVPFLNIKGSNNYPLDKNYFKIHNFEFRPEKLIIERGVLGQRNLFLFWIDNKSSYSNNKLKEKVKTDILNYNSTTEIKFLN